MKRFLERVSRVLFVIGTLCIFAPILLGATKDFFIGAWVILVFACALALTSIVLHPSGVINNDWEKARKILGTKMKKA